MSKAVIQSYAPCLLGPRHGRPVFKRRGRFHDDENQYELAIFQADDGMFWRAYVYVESTEDQQLIAFQDFWLRQKRGKRTLEDRNDDVPDLVQGSKTIEIPKSWLKKAPPSKGLILPGLGETIE